MNKPTWEWIHEERVNDLRFDLFQIFRLKQLVEQRIHLESDVVKSCILEVKKHLKNLVKEYQEIYGDEPDIWKLRREVEYEGWKP